MRKDIFNLTIKLGAVFILVSVLFGVTYYENAELAKELLEPYFDTLGAVIEDDGGINLVALWRNNLFVCVKSVAMGIIPLVFLPLLTLLSNATVVGSVFGLAAAEAQVELADAILYMILPHGVFELPAMFITFALGFYLCQFMTRRFFRKPVNQTFVEVMNGVAKGFVLVVIPLLTIAALVECYVTPEIMAWAGL